MLSFPEESLKFAPADYDVNKIGFTLVEGGTIKDLIKMEKIAANPKPIKKPAKTVAQYEKNFCHICERGYMTTSNLRRHMRTIHENIYQCEKCKMQFTGETAHAKHKLHKCSKQSEGAEIFKCDTCGHLAKTRENLIWHLELHRKLDIDIDDIFA